MSWLDRIFALAVSMHRRAENARWQKCGRSAKAYQGLRGDGPEMRSRSITRLKLFVSSNIKDILHRHLK